MVAAAENGLPVDLTQVPPSPSSAAAATQPTSSVLAHLVPAQEGDGATFDLIDQQLQKQVGRHGFEVEWRWSRARTGLVFAVA